MHVPESQENYQCGVFMTTLVMTQSEEAAWAIANGSFKTHDQGVTSLPKVECSPRINSCYWKISRPSLLVYRSTLFGWLRTIIWIIPFTLGWLDDSQSLNVMLMKNFVDNSSVPYNWYLKKCIKLLTMLRLG
eukprot:m.62230 g.62230  ORF g.62230 m.62230 type:complete len:132 (-) comp11498_c0_seq4:23-418(-)